MATKDRPSNFIRAKIDADLEAGRYGQVVTRFPPEPNGYLHIGHAKSICLNFGLARDYQGRCHLRMDDTNPAKEDTEYVDAIQNDVRWLGFDWNEHLYFASNYFEQLYAYAVTLIDQGLAYVDSLSVEEIREHRGTLTEAGHNSPYRDRSVSESLALFKAMRAGDFEDGAHVLRAKIDMSAKNMLMRDPLLYRIRHAHHHRTGNDWCIYPMYDYAHCLSDAIEGVTHSICTLEFENNRELYDWILEAVDVPHPRPEQTEFAKLGLDYTVMSKRNLRAFVMGGHVASWDDPRMPTIAGLRRRGVTPAAVRAFAEMVGVAKANSVVDLDKFDFCIRDDLNHKVRRVQAVLRPLKVVVTNWPEGQVDELEAPYYPHDVPLEGSRTLHFSGELYIERGDFMEDPPKKFFRLAPGREVRLRYGYYLTCTDVVKDASGEVIELRCTYDPASRGGTTEDGRKVRGTLHWVSAPHAVDATARLYDRLFRVPAPGSDPDRDVLDDMNPDSLQVIEGAKIEPSIAHDPPGTRYQFERQGYFISDVVDSKLGALVFNRIVGLRDTWAKLQQKKVSAPDPSTRSARPARPAERDRRRPDRRSRSELREAARRVDAELKERYDRYRQLGLSDKAADLLSGERQLGDFFEAALVTYDAPAALSRWVVNELAREVKDRSTADVGITPEALAQITEMVSDGAISNAAGRQVFAELVANGGDVSATVDRLGLHKVTDASSLEPLVAKAVADHPAEVAKYLEGRTQLIGFFIGKVMQASGGSADAKIVRQLVRDALQR